MSSLVVVPQNDPAVLALKLEGPGPVDWREAWRQRPAAAVGGTGVTTLRLTVPPTVDVQLCQRTPGGGGFALRGVPNLETVEIDAREYTGGVVRRMLCLLAGPPHTPLRRLSLRLDGWVPSPADDPGHPNWAVADCMADQSPVLHLRLGLCGPNIPSAIVERLLNTVRRMPHLVSLTVDVRRSRVGSEALLRALRCVRDCQFWLWVCSDADPPATPNAALRWTQDDPFTDARAWAGWIADVQHQPPPPSAVPRPNAICRLDRNLLGEAVRFLPTGCRRVLAGVDRSMRDAVRRVGGFGGAIWSGTPDQLRWARRDHLAEAYGAVRLYLAPSSGRSTTLDQDLADLGRQPRPSWCQEALAVHVNLDHDARYDEDTETEEEEGAAEETPPPEQQARGYDHDPGPKREEWVALLRRCPVLVVEGYLCRHLPRLAEALDTEGCMPGWMPPWHAATETLDLGDAEGINTLMKLWEAFGPALAAGRLPRLRRLTLPPNVPWGCGKDPDPPLLPGLVYLSAPYALGEACPWSLLRSVPEVRLEHRKAWFIEEGHPPVPAAASGPSGTLHLRSGLVVDWAKWVRECATAWGAPPASLVLCPPGGADLDPVVEGVAELGREPRIVPGTIEVRLRAYEDGEWVAAVRRLWDEAHPDTESLVVRVGPVAEPSRFHTVTRASHGNWLWSQLATGAAGPHQRTLGEQDWAAKRLDVTVALPHDLRWQLSAYRAPTPAL